MKSNLPNFIVAGVMKGSTTAAAFNLNKHLEVYCVTARWKAKVNNFHGHDISNLVMGLGNEGTKEMDFFNKELNYQRGLEFYKSYFPQYRIAMGESSPNYFYVNAPESSKTVERMKRDIPNAKIIIILRDPINRSFSHWNHIQKPQFSFSPQFKGKTFNECTEKWGTFENNNIIQRSLYLDNLNSYIEGFGKENIYVTTQEAIKADNFGEYNKMYTFLGVDTLDVNPGYKVNALAVSYNTTIDDASKTFLQTYLKSDVEGVKALYPDLDYSSWNTY
mgnify:CR=1 FL=1|tara:strand:- start:1331 stop:2158 length:828 start_codon:yes stop_codon:yes gene_type:complete